MTTDQAAQTDIREGKVAPLAAWPQPDDRGPHPLVQLVIARLREFFRQPEAIFWVYGFPIMMAAALGIAFRNPQQQVIIVDVVETPGAKLVAAALEAPSSTSPGESSSDAAPQSPHYEVQVLAEEAARQRLRTGRSALVILARSKRESADALEELELEYLYDPTRPDGVLARASADDMLQRAAGRGDPVEVESVAMREPGGRYIDFLIPGLLGASLVGGGLWGVGFVTVDMRVRNLLKRFVTTPMKKSHFLLGLMLSRFFFMVTEVLVLLIFARFVFNVHVLGSFTLLMGFVVLGALTFAGIGLLVASRAKTIETASGLINLVMLPMWLLSGIFFSSERFPDAVQPLIKLLPLTPLINAMRAIMIEAAPAVSLVDEAAILAVWGVLSFFIALAWFRWY